LIRTPGLYLVGFMGSGKSTVGRLLADELGWEFTDLDDEIEVAAGSSIARIFEDQGEDEFRRREHDALAREVRRVQLGRPAVISLGGGAFPREENYKLVADNGVSVWLDCPLALILRRIEGHGHRPLARDPDRFASLFHERQGAYARADYRVEVRSDDPGETVRAVLALPVF
jgi:shikimate kinase